jgi:magnesium transporter
MDSLTTEVSFEELKDLLNGNQIAEFRDEFLDHHIYDQSRFFLELTAAERQELYAVLDPAEVADIFDAIDFDDVEDLAVILGEIAPSYLTAVFENMSSDNISDLMDLLPDDKQSVLYDLMDNETESEVRELSEYDDDSAGALMTTEYVSIFANQTVKSAMTVLKQQAADAETIYYLYVVNKEKQLLGVVSLRDLVVSKDDHLINDLINDHIIKLQADDDRDKVAQTFRDYDLLAIPVVGNDNEMLGIVTVDDVIDVIDEEAATDYSGLAGVDTEEVSQNPLLASSKRLPWLIALLFLGLGTASLINHFDTLVAQASVLAVFVSLITGTAGNAGTQSLAVAVRRLALHDDESDNSFFKMILSEILTGMITGLVTGVTIFAVVSLWKGNIVLGFAVGMAMFAAITVANLAGSLIPILMDRLGFDPAVASGPFITTMSDLTSVFIYFNIASLFINSFMK